jgi:AcrR family transcriptional regulator
MNPDLGMNLDDLPPATLGSSERRILEQTLPVLAEGLGRSMQEVAEISGIGRTTLYRHFKTREDLIRAIHVLAMEEAITAVRESRLEEGSAEEAMRRLVAALCSIGNKYRVLLAHQPAVMKEMGQSLTEISGPLYALVQRGQREGVFTESLSPRWVLSAMGSLVVAAIKLVQEGDLARNHAPDMVTDTLLVGIRSRSAGGDPTPGVKPTPI